MKKNSKDHGIDNYGILSLPCNVPEPEFARELSFANFTRAKIALGGFLAAGVLFFILRLCLFSVYNSLPGYKSLFFLNMIIIAGSASLLVIFQRVNPGSSEFINPLHTLLVHTSALFFVLLMSVASGVEYIGTGTLTRFFFTIFTLCIVFTINWYTLLIYFVASAGTMVLTIYLYNGDIMKLGVEHMHIPVLLIVSWFVARSFYLASARDYYIRRQLEKTNTSLKEEIQGRLQAMDDLKRSEEQLKSLFDNAPDAYMLYDSDQCVFTEINAYAEALFDYKNEEVAGKNYSDLGILTEEQCLLVEGIITETLAKSFAGPYEFPLHLRDGRFIVAEVRSSLTTLQHRTLLLATARDITWRKIAEEELRKSNTDLELRVRERSERVEEANKLLKQEISDHRRTEKVLRKTEEQSLMLIEKMNDGFVVFDKDMIISYANERLCEMLGLSWDDIVGNSIYDFVPDEQIPGLKNHLGTRTTRDQRAYETILRNKGGQQIHAYISPEALYGQDGNIEERFSVITDITRIKSMEAALRESEEMTRALLDASRDSVVLLKPDGTIFMVNEMLANNLKANGDFLKGKNIFQFIPPSRNSFRKKQLMESVLRKEPVIYEDDFMGSHFLMHIYPINDKDPSIERIAVFARDISDLKKAEKHIHSLSQELIKVQENERQRISRDLHDNVAQELASMKITCETLFDDHHHFPLDVIKKVNGFSMILQNTIMSVRNMAYDLRPPGLDQLGLVSTMGNYCEDFSGRNRIEIDFFSAGVAGLSLSPDTEINLYRIVQEALHNITKHARATLVTIRLTASFPTIILRIEDNGQGFDVKKTLENAYVEKRMGVRSMEERVRLLSGKIEIRSQKDKGTKIMVEIPMMTNIIERDDKGAHINE
ncbi:MAG: PAS domain S-box protein [Proteobacteria bacterium]|nr:PAS domain S-box protein [Pseudomonadota bacterium]